MAPLSLRNKFALLFGGFGVAIGVIVTTNFGTSSTVASRLDETREQLLPRLVVTNSIRERFKDMSLLLEDAAVYGESSFLDDSDEANQLLSADLDRLISLSPETDKTDLQRIRQQALDFHSLARELAEKLLTLEDSDELSELSQVATLGREVRTLREDLALQLDSLSARASQDLNAELRSTEKEVTDRAMLTLVVGVVSLLCGLSILLFLTGRIVAPIRALSLATAEVARGNLDETISVSTSRDEVGDLVESFRLMSMRLQETTVSRDFVDNIIDSMGDSLIVLDANFRVVMVNPATSRLLGYDDGELSGRPFRDVMAREFSSVEDLVEEQYLTKQGLAIPVSLVGAVLRGEDGQPTGFVCVAQDHTERKKAEQDLLRARDAAEDASLAKSAFLANTSHEIRTPINAVMGMAQALQSEDLPPGTADQVDTILQASEALAEIIDDLLDLSKIEAGQLEAETVPFDPVEVVERVRRTLALRADDKGTSLTVTIDPDTARDVEGDVVRLRQILMNLIGNGLKFTEQGSVDVRLSSVPEQGRVRLRVAVQDSGIGIDVDRQAVIFDPFTQADPSITRTHGGTGLGLSISKRLVNMMEGEISVDSRPGEGSTFHFDVLVNAGTGRAAPTIQDKEEPIRPLRILLAEDNPLNRKVARALLRMDSHDITDAENGQIAVDVVRTSPAFDVILMDMQMPVMDGLTATAQIRRLQADAGAAPTPVRRRRRCGADADHRSHGERDEGGQGSLSGSGYDRLH
ncbi:MAG: PAS domain S-box protein, partial [Gemmatimonadetes bacterium]|nr:PAS domain S-box protein [Gemmatimonadota bacterium]